MWQARIMGRRVRVRICCPGGWGSNVSFEFASRLKVRAGYRLGTPLHGLASTTLVTCCSDGMDKTLRFQRRLPPGGGHAKKFRASTIAAASARGVESSGKLRTGEPRRR